MDILIPIGSVVAFAGLCGLGYCIWLAYSARRAGLTGEAMQARMQKVVALNMAAMGVSALGLMMVVVGVML